MVNDFDAAPGKINFLDMAIPQRSFISNETRCLDPASTVERLKARKGRNRDPLRLKCNQPFMHM